MGIIDKVFDDPFLGGVEATNPKGKKAAKEMNDMLVEMNGIEFHRQMYQFMVKPMFEHAVKAMTGGKATPDQMNIDDFLYAFTVNFFAKYLLGKEKLTNGDRVKFFKKVYDDMNAFDYVFLAHTLPTGRKYTHFLVWEK